MAKPIRLRMTDNTGKVFIWTVQHHAAINCTIGQKNRRVVGWMFRDHDGVERFVEGAWRDLVPQLKLVADNYGFATTIS